MRSIALALALALGAVACVHASVPAREDMAHTARSLESVLPTIQQIHVEGFRSQDWCRFLDYPRGAFTNIVDEGSACNVFRKVPEAFDERATADFQVVQGALQDSRVSVWMVWNVTYDNAGGITAAQFDVVAGSFDRFSYLYSRDGPVAGDEYQAIAFQQVDDHWWFLSEDFN